MGSKRHFCALHLRLLLVSSVLLSSLYLSQAAAPSPTAEGELQVRLVFPGLDQTVFDRKYGKPTLSALAISAGVPESYITWVNMPPAATTKPAAAAATRAAAAPAAANSSAAAEASAPSDVSAKRRVAAPTAAAAAASAAKASNTTAAKAGAAVEDRSNAAMPFQLAAAPAADAVAAAGSVKPAAAAGTVTSVTMLGSSSDGSSSSKTLDSKGARRLLQQTQASQLAATSTTAAAARAQSGAVGVYKIITTTEVWATDDAIRQKLQTSVAPPGYSFLGNLKRRGVPYEPSVFVDGGMILEGRAAFSAGPRDRPVAVSDASASRLRTSAPADQSSGNKIGPLPLWIFIPVVILGALLAVLLVVAICVLSWIGLRAYRKHRQQHVEEKERGQFIVKSGNSSESGSEVLTRAPGGGFAPTQGALEQLNATFPVSSSATKPTESLASEIRSVTTAYTTATTVKSTAGLLTAQDGKKNRVAKNSSAPVSDHDMDYYRSYQKEGKPVPILPHSRIVKPGASSIRVPGAKLGASSSAAAAAAANDQ